jgi:hypothetical protein
MWTRRAPRQQVGPKTDTNSNFGGYVNPIIRLASPPVVAEKPGQLSPNDFEPSAG